MHRIVSVVVLDSYRLDLTFEDGTRGLADLHELVGSGVFALRNDYSACSEGQDRRQRRACLVGCGGSLSGFAVLRVTGKSPTRSFRTSRESP